MPFCLVIVGSGSDCFNKTIFKINPCTSIPIVHSFVALSYVPGRESYFWLIRPLINRHLHVFFPWILVIFLIVVTMYQQKQRSGPQYDSREVSGKDMCYTADQICLPSRSHKSIYDQ